MKNVTVITHPLIQQNLTRLRDQSTQPEEFRRALGEVAALMVYEATRTFATQSVTVQTPLERTWDPLESTCRHASLSIL